MWLQLKQSWSHRACCPEPELTGSTWQHKHPSDGSGSKAELAHAGGTADWEVQVSPGARSGRSRAGGT